MKILSISDRINPLIYSPRIRDQFSDIDIIISCGDLEFYYLEYIISMLNKPLYYVHGNHVTTDEMGDSDRTKNPWGAIDLHQKVIYDNENDLILAGIEGSTIYNHGAYQYSQLQMWKMVLRIVPELLLNKIKHGRYLDIFVSHASPKGIHDEGDVAHKGIAAFKWLIKTFKPRYHFHGHIHLYDNRKKWKTMTGKTTVINTYGYRKTNY